MFGRLAMAFFELFKCLLMGDVFGDKSSYLSMLGIINPNKN
jgi:hypothetical protein